MNNNLEPISLLSLNALVRGVVEQGLPGNYWVVGELSEVRETTAGHCYIELIERSAAKNDLVAKARGTIWARIYSILKPYFLEQTGPRIKILHLKDLKRTEESHFFAEVGNGIAAVAPVLGALQQRHQVEIVDAAFLDIVKMLPDALQVARKAVGIHEHAQHLISLIPVRHQLSGLVPVFQKGTAL